MSGIDRNGGTDGVPAEGPALRGGSRPPESMLARRQSGRSVSPAANRTGDLPRSASRGAADHSPVERVFGAKADRVGLAGVAINSTGLMVASKSLPSSLVGRIKSVDRTPVEPAGAKGARRGQEEACDLTRRPASEAAATIRINSSSAKECSPAVLAPPLALRRPGNSVGVSVSGALSTDVNTTSLMRVPGTDVVPTSLSTDVGPTSLTSGSRGARGTDVDTTKLGSASSKESHGMAGESAGPRQRLPIAVEGGMPPVTEEMLAAHRKKLKDAFSRGRGPRGRGPAPGGRRRSTGVGVGVSVVTADDAPRDLTVAKVSRKGTSAATQDALRDLTVAEESWEGPEITASLEAYTITRAHGGNRVVARTTGDPGRVSADARREGRLGTRDEEDDRAGTEGSSGRTVTWEDEEPAENPTKRNRTDAEEIIPQYHRTVRRKGSDWTEQWGQR